MPIDPITLEVVRNWLMMAAKEVRITVERTAYSVVIYECVDFSCGIFDAEANLIAETSGLPIFLANLGDAIKTTYETIGRENLEAGDTIFCNDPYCGGGTHCPDCTCLYPVFYKNKLVGFTGFRGHTLDMGGKAAGGWYSDTTEVFQEGVRFPPVKLYMRGKLNRSVYDIIKHNTRVPDMVLGDIRAMIAATRTGGDRIIKLIDKYGLETVQECIKEIMDHGESMARRAVRKIPEGTYSAEYILDGDGSDDSPISERLRLKVTVKVKGDEMTIDFTGTSPQSKGPMNVPKPSTISSARYAFKLITTPFLPNNEGCFRPLNIIIPKGSILDPVSPAACAMWPTPTTSIPDLIMEALASAIPDKIRAGHFGDSMADFIYGIDPRTGKYYVLAEPVAGGYGGKPFEDGESCLHSMDLGDTYNVPMEVLEVNYPLMVERWELIEDSGGAGKHRGGLGTRKDYRILGEEAGLTVTADRAVYTPPRGLFGAKSGRPNISVIYRTDGTVERWRKVTDLRLKNGDVISFCCGGGGGYGNPLERDPGLVRSDVVNGYVSLKSTREDYRVIIDPKTYEVDREATKKLREELEEK